MISALKKLFTGNAQLHAAHEAYMRIVAQARTPAFFTSYQVPDTLDGRFDSIVLHMCLVIERVQQETSQEAADFSRSLQEVFFSDMDRSLREMGTGDTGISVRVKKMAQAFYGRLHAYNDAFELKDALARNLYRGAQVDPALIDAVSAYIARNNAVLAQQPADAILTGDVSFSD